MPDEVVRGKKRGFEVPLSRWLEGDLYELVHDALGSSTALVLEFVDRQLIGEILSGGVAREWNEPALVYALLVLELWLHAERARGLAA